MPRIRYVADLGTAEDRIRVDFETQRGQVTALHVVQYETLSHGQWHPVARYDTAHGYVHLDLQTRSSPVKYRTVVQNLGGALTFALEDLKTNWKNYKRRFLDMDS